MQTDNLRKYFWLLLNLLIAGLVVNLLLFVMPTIKKFGDSLQPVRTITVSAEGKTVVVPDIAQLSFSVVTRGEDPNRITDENNKKINAAIEFVKSEGIDKKDIKTSGYYLSPDYKYDPDTERRIITGYTLTQTVDVKIRDFGKISDIMAGLTPLGINQISGVNFTVDEPEKFLTEARAEGFAKARAKAEAMARQNNISLGRVITVNESSGGFPYYYRDFAKAEGFGAAPAPTAPTIEPGTQELKVQVSVTYSLE